MNGMHRAGDVRVADAVLGKRVHPVSYHLVCWPTNRAEPHIGKQAERRVVESACKLHLCECTLRSGFFGKGQCIDDAMDVVPPMGAALLQGDGMVSFRVLSRIRLASNGHATG